ASAGGVSSTFDGGRRRPCSNSPDAGARGNGTWRGGEQTREGSSDLVAGRSVWNVARRDVDQSLPAWQQQWSAGQFFFNGLSIAGCGRGADCFSSGVL